VTAAVEQAEAHPEERPDRTLDRPHRLRRERPRHETEVAAGRLRVAVEAVHEHLELGGRGERLARDRVHDAHGHALHRQGCRHDVHVQADAVGYDAHDLGQREPIRAHDVVRASDRARPVQRRRDRLRDVAHVHRLQDRFAASDHGNTAAKRIMRTRCVIMSSPGRR
jgi:hypothetical protein